MVTKTKTFNHTGSRESWSVPDGVTHLTLECWGAEGGDGRYSDGGYGGYVRGDISVVPGETLYITVGGKGADHASGGWPNGGEGGYGTAEGDNGPAEAYGGGGGGSTDIRYDGSTIGDIILGAGGGGGGGDVNPDTFDRYIGTIYEGDGGYGGGEGGDGSDDSNVSSGLGGAAGSFDGTNGDSDSAVGDDVGAMAAGGGGGGGGLDGGTGGGAWVGSAADDGSAAGGGGGDGYIDSQLSNTTVTADSNSSDGQVTITWEVPDPAVKVWSGSFWEYQALREYDGTNWSNDDILKYYDGSSWVELHY